MNENEFNDYKFDARPKPMEHLVRVGDVPGPDRTLVLGYSRVYDDDGNEATHNVHVYKRAGELHTVHYTHDKTRVRAESGTNIPIVHCLPRKRAFPERCDASFAYLLRSLDAALPFTNYDESRLTNTANATPGFFGPVIEDTH